MSQTLRSIGGAKPATHIDPSRTALVLIDFQNEYFDGRLPVPNAIAAERQAVRLVKLADEHGMMVVHVRHINPATAPVFAKGSLNAEIHNDLPVAPHHIIVDKTTVSTFASTDLDARLRAAGVDTLILTGLMTHMCISTMARDARQFGAARNYNVLVAADATASRDIDGWNGGVTPHEVLHNATLTALSDNFAEVLTTAAILDLPVAQSSSSAA